MKKKKRLNSKWLLLLVLSIIVTATGMQYVIAKYTGSAAVAAEADLQGFDVSPVITTSYESWASDTGIVTMTAAQYAAFKLDIEKTGDGWAYIRVSVKESWRVRTTASGAEVAAITTGGSLVWDSALLTNSADTFHYVDGIVTDNPKTISIINGSNTAPTDITVSNGQELVVRLSIKVEAIQYNRLNAFWGLSGNPL